MSQHPETSTDKTEPADKKMMRGSFAISLLVHGTILLLLGSIIIVPGVVRQMSHIAQVAPPPSLPEAPKMEEEETPDAAKSDDGGGSPIGDVPDPSSTSTTQDATMDALTVNSPVSAGPSMNASSGASSVPGAFAGGKGGSGGGTGTGVGRGSGSGVGRGTGFKLFGSKEKLDDSFIGRFYDLKQDRSRKKTNPDTPKIWKDFVAGSFSASKLSNYFSPPDVLYATYVMVPIMQADAAPKAYNVEKEVEPTNWGVHYQAMVAPTVDGTYRFDGVADDYLVVGINSHVVLDGSLTVAWMPTSTADPVSFVGPLPKGLEASNWKNKEPRIHNFGGSWYPIVPGDWIEWKANDFKKMDILISERPGGQFCAILLIEEKGKTYETGPDGCPILPLFRVDPARVEMPADIDKRTYPAFIMGPIFKAKHLR